MTKLKNHLNILILYSNTSNIKQIIFLFIKLEIAILSFVTKYKLLNYYLATNNHQASNDYNFFKIISATFLPDKNIPPKIGPIRGAPNTAFAAIPVTYKL